MIVTMTLQGQDRIIIQEPEIFIAACEGNVVKLKSLLGDTADIEVQNQQGASLLHKAVECSQVEVVAYLIEIGIDINKEDNLGRTPLFIAVETKNEELADLLRNKNAKVNFNIINENGLSPIDDAIWDNDLSTIEFLIQHGANVNSVNLKGNTPTRTALEGQNDEILNYLISQGAKEEMPELKGNYLGQDTPGHTPKIFAPGFVSTDRTNINASFNPNGQELYFTAESPRYSRGTIMVSKVEGGVWTFPEQLKKVGDYTAWEPFVSRDGMKLYYVTNRPTVDGDSVNDDMDVWVLNREESGWSDPVHIGDNINTTLNELHPTVSDNGNLYYGIAGKGIYHSTFKNGHLQESKSWRDPNDTLNWNGDPFIAPDESFLIYASERPGGIGRSDMYISFRNKNGSWNPSINMGDELNSLFDEYPSGLSPDGKYFFFASARLGGIFNIYWVDAQVIQDLR